MIYWGINALNHGSSLAILKDNELIHYQFYPTDELPQEEIKNKLENLPPDKIYWYENPWHKKLRQAKAGQWNRVFDINDIPSIYLQKNSLNICPLEYTPHHASHASAGYYTSSFDDASIVVLDAIGEFDCATIWHGQGDNIKKVWSKRYPNSLGLFYSAFTHLLGFKPVAEEYKLQQLAEHGDPNRYYFDVKEYMGTLVNAHKNMHRGIQDWPYPILENDKSDIAAAVQEIFEEQIKIIMTTAIDLTKSKNLIYMGGCAMNDRANRSIQHLWDNIWSLKNPGDPSSAIGAILYHTKNRILGQTNGFRT